MMLNLILQWNLISYNRSKIDLQSYILYQTQKKNTINILKIISNMQILSIHKDFIFSILYLFLLAG